MREIFFSFTAGGEAASLAACKAVLKELDEGDVIKQLWKRGDRLQDSVTTLTDNHGLSDYVRCIGPSPKSVIDFKDKSGESSLLLRSLFQQEVAARGILFLTGHSICAALAESDIDETLAAYNDAFGVIARALDSDNPQSLMRGKVAQPVFRKA